MGAETGSATGSGEAGSGTGTGTGAGSATGSVMGTGAGAIETGESSRTNLRRCVTGSRMSLNLGVFGVERGGGAIAL